MKSVRRICAASALTLTLTLYAFGGEIHVPGLTPPPPPAPTLPTTATTGGGTIGTGGEIPPPGATEANPMASAIELALNLMRTVLSLF